jgi:SAM-dependent methyltransferase
MSKSINNYLKKFHYGKNLSKIDLTSEIDKVWDSYNIRNYLDYNKIKLFYNHPVWILNGLFSKNNINSVNHREAISKYICSLKNKKLNIADFGGGSGYLASILAKNLKDLKSIDIIEPFPSNYFRKKINNPRIFFKKKLKKNYYDIIILQTVLEHVHNPIDTALECINALKIDGHIFFGSDFYPIEKCHLKENFYLRHTFNFIIRNSSLEYKGRVPDCNYMEIFYKNSKYSSNFLYYKVFFAKYFIGIFLNYAHSIYVCIKRFIYKIFIK